MHKKSIVLLLCVGFSINLHAQDIEWEKSYGGKQADYLFDVQPTADYGFILAGSSLSKKTGNKTEENNGNLDYWIQKMDEKGNAGWQKNFGGSGADLLQSLKLTTDGGFILAGISDSQKDLHKKDSCKGKDDFWIIKLNAKGDEEWQRTIGGTGQEQLQAVYQTTDGGYILGGSSASGWSKPGPDGLPDPYGKNTENYGSLDYWVVKLDSKGTIEWQQTFGGQYLDQLRSIEQTKDGGYILGGYSNSPQSGNKSEKCYGDGDYWVIKLDKNGKEEWEQVYGGDGDDQLYVIHQAYDGNYILAGNSASGSSGNKSASNRSGTDFWVLKIDDKGSILWQQTYNIGKTDLLTSMVENDDHSLLLGGYARTEVSRIQKKEPEGVNDYIAIRTDEKGEETWRQHIGSSGEDILRKVIEMRDGGYLLAGTSSGKVSRDRNSGNGSSDFWVVKLKDKDKKKEQKNAIEAYPNPTSQFSNVIVGYEFKKGTAYVYDLAGHQLQSFPVTERTVPVDLSGQPEGIYIVEIRTEVQSDAVKIIKNY